MEGECSWYSTEAFTKELQMAIDTSTCINILPDEEWYYSVEDINIAVSTDGCTISYWQDGKRHTHITMEKEEAVAVADAIYKLFKN
jgi:hypothetical protein